MKRRNKSTREERRRLSLEQLESREVLATFVVTSNADSGEGTLREAIAQANSTTEFDRVEFAIESASKKIQLQSALPTISEPLEIDGTTQPGFSDTPIVELDGSQLTGNLANGLLIQGSDTLIAGLSIYGFPASGIRIEESSSTTVQQNFVGLAPDGSVPHPNGFAGVLIRQSSDSLIGGPGKGNVLSGNATEGIRLEGSLTTSNRVQGNRIGTDQAGTQAIPNSLDGVLVSSGANSNWIGTDGDGVRDDAEGNQVSGNTRFGIRVYHSSDNVLAGNLVGTNALGTGTLGNGDSGIQIDSESHRNLVGSNGDKQSDTLERNIVSGNGRDGVIVRDNATSNNLSGNYVGTSADGLSSIPNALSGVSFFALANGNLVGSQDGQYLGNLIAGNTQNGIWIGESHTNTIAGNVIGLDKTGNQALRNGGRGIVVGRGSTNNLMGTNDNGKQDELERNVISGNFHQGIVIGGLGSDNNIIAGNFIGTSVSGTSAIPNTSSGILINGDAKNNIIGTTTNSRDQSAAGNVISGNDFWGIRFRNRSSQNSAKGNLIGTDPTGFLAVPNLAGGIGTFQESFNNTIGGKSTKERNIVSGNGGWGIDMLPGSGDNQVIGNWIGVAADGVTEMGNETGGILISDASNNTIGDSTAEGANTIAHNGDTGIAIEGDNARNNLITRNSIFGHNNIGIDLGNDGNSPNDPADRDSGPNDLQNAPELIFVTSSTGMGHSVQGFLDSRPNSEYRIELYVSPDQPGPGEGLHYLHSFGVQTDARGISFWNADLPTIEASDSVIAIASGLDGTSEFSNALNPVAKIEVSGNAKQFSEDEGYISISFERGDIPINESVHLSVRTSDNKQAQILNGETFIKPEELTGEIKVWIVDDSIVEPNQPITVYATRVNGEGAGAWEFEISDNDKHAWYNSFQPEDVNGDRFVSPIDALVVINFLNSAAQTDLSGAPPAPSTFVDVNNDMSISPIDALIVINSLNNRASGEAESADLATLGERDFLSLESQWSLVEFLLKEKLKRSLTAPAS